MLRERVALWAALPGLLGSATALAAITERVSVSTAGEEANGYSAAPAMSGDGRYVAFLSDASNLVPGDTNEYCDVPVRGPGDVTLEVGEAGASPRQTATVPVSLTQTAGWPASSLTWNTRPRRPLCR